MFNTPFNRIQVRVAHADPLVALGLSTVLSQQSDMEVVIDGEHRPLGRDRAQVVVADYVRGLALVAPQGRAASARQVAPRERPAQRVLVVTAHDREHEVRSALEAGVQGYIELGCQVDELINGVRQLARGSRYLSARAAQRVADSMSRSHLTDRELEVLTLVAAGKSNKAVALDLDISAGTVKAHMKAILSKLSASTRTEAANVARDRGLIAAVRGVSGDQPKGNPPVLRDEAAVHWRHEH